MPFTRWVSFEERSVLGFEIRIEFEESIADKGKQSYRIISALRRMSDGQI
jgi:hypothetical protein